VIGCLAIGVELADPDRAQALDALAERALQGPVTLVFGARDSEHNQAVVIADELERCVRIRCPRGDRHVQHAVATVAEEVVGCGDVAERERVGDEGGADRSGRTR
jgi:Protein of unknown function, DUF488